MILAFSRHLGGSGRLRNLDNPIGISMFWAWGSQGSSGSPRNLFSRFVMDFLWFSCRNWRFDGISEFPRKFCCKAVLARVCAQIIVFPKEYQEFWASTFQQICQKSWCFMNFQEIWWCFMKFHDIWWNFDVLSGVIDIFPVLNRLGAAREVVGGFKTSIFL